VSTSSPTISLPLLDRVQTASPCSVRWEDMTGDDRTRHCAQCRLDVHDISKMARAEAEAFLAARFGVDGQPSGQRICAQIFRRADGTIITADCPVGLAAVRARARKAVARAAAVLGITALAAAAAAALENRQRMPWCPSQPFAAIAKLVGRTTHINTGIRGGIILLPTKPSTGAHR